MARRSRSASARAGRRARRSSPRSGVGLIAALLVIAVSLSGCMEAALNGTYLNETAERAYLADEFSGWTDWLFEQRTANGASWEQGIRDGYFISRGPNQFLYSWESVPTDVTVVVDWEIWYDSATPVRDNSGQLDFEVMLDVSETGGSEPFGPAVAAKFYDTEGLPAVDRLTVGSSTLTGTQTRARSRDATVFPALRSGTLAVRFDREREIPTISATVTDGAGDALLSGSLEVPDGWPGSGHVMISVWGVREGWRVLDSVTVYPVDGYQWEGAQ